MVCIKAHQLLYTDTPVQIGKRAIVCAQAHTQKGGRCNFTDYKDSRKKKEKKNQQCS